MLDEQMDDMIREAAEKHHPAYHDDAWEKMQQKLDAEMPQKPAKKRYIYYLLLLLLMGGAVYTGVQYFKEEDKSDHQEITRENKNNNNPGTTSQNNTATGEAAGITNTVVDAGNNIASPENNNSSGNNPSTATGTNPANSGNRTNVPGVITGTTGNQTVTAKIPVDQNANEDLATVKNKRSKARLVTPGGQAIKLKQNISRNKKDGSITGTGAGEALANASPKTKLTSKGKTSMRISSPATTADLETNPAGEPATDPGTANTTTLSSTGKINEQKDKEDKADSLKKEEIAKAKKTNTDSTQLVTAPKEKTKKKGFAGNFGITVSAGTDASFIKLDRIGKATFIYGAGLSYDMGKRFTVQAGFYVSKKIYSAGADQYNPPGGNYPNFTGADAVCKVYEIPVSVNYNFGQRGNHSWFAGVGLSSFLMKKEDYDYNYKNPSGQVYSYKHSVSNENKHYFSVLNLTAGYKYNFNDRISIMAAPFLKLPLGGVGVGDIKLKSGGVLFTATVKPFVRRKK